MATGEAIDTLYRQAKGLRDTMLVIDSRDQGNMARFGSYKTFMRKYNQLAQAAAKLVPESAGILDVYALDKVGNSMNTIGLVQKDLFESTLANLSLLIGLLENAVGIAESEIQQLADFFDARLRPAILRTPGSERDVQDTVEQLLIGRGLQKGSDYDREKGRVKVSAKEVIPDFIFPPLKAALEVKLISADKKRSEIIDEINADILSYRSAYEHVLFVVYDLGFVRDPIEFRSDLEAQPGVTVVIVKQ